MGKGQSGTSVSMRGSEGRFCGRTGADSRECPAPPHLHTELRVPTSLGGTFVLVFHSFPDIQVVLEAWRSFGGCRGRGCECVILGGSCSHDRLQL